MQKKWPKCVRISKQTEDHSIGRLLIEKKYGGTATSSYSVTDKFLQYIYSVLVAKNHQKIRSRCLVYSAAELNNIDSEDKVFAQEFQYEESDYGDINDEDI